MEQAHSPPLAPQSTKAFSMVVGSGKEMLLSEGRKRFIDVSSLTSQQDNTLQFVTSQASIITRFVTSQALTVTHQGEAIANFDQMALLGKSTSILSCIQIGSHDADTNEKPCLNSGDKQHILMFGYKIPMDINNGQASLP
jgi:hypothetical protein